MSGYITQYEGLDNRALLSLFGAESWDGMNLFQRMDACQEVENRYAQAYNIAPCRVTCQPMEGAVYGAYQGGTICLNSHMVGRGVFVSADMDENGNYVMVETAVPAANWNTLDTVFHEGTHSLQDSMGTMPGTYISPDMDGDLYRIQGVEKEAFSSGQRNTLMAIQAVQEDSGKIDSQAAAYYAAVQYDSFDSALKSAAAHYNDPDIENTLSQVIQDRDNGTVPQAPSPSYTAIHSLCGSPGLQESAADTMHGSSSGVNLDDGAAGLEAADTMGGSSSGVNLDDGASGLETAGTMDGGSSGGSFDSGGSHDGLGSSPDVGPDSGGIDME